MEEKSNTRQSCKEIKALVEGFLFLLYEVQTEK